MATKNAIVGLGRKKLVIKINFHQFGPKVFDSLTLNLFLKSKFSQFFLNALNIYLFIPSPQMLKKKLFFGCTLSIFRYPCYYFLTTKYSALNYLFEPESCISPFLNLVVPGTLYTILTVLLGDPTNTHFIFD